MTKKNSGDPEDPELQALAIEERKAEVQTKKARAESATADAHKKKRDAGLEDSDPDLKSKLSGGVTRDKYATICRKLPGEARWPYWKKALPLDEVDSLEEYITAEGDPRYEHKVQIYNDRQQPIGKPVFFPAQEVDSTGASLSSTERQLKEVEQKIRERKAAKKLEKRMARLERMEEGADEDDEEDNGRRGDDDWVELPHLGAWVKRGSAAHMASMNGMNPFMGQQKTDSDSSLLKTLVPVLVAWISRPAPPPASSPLQDISLLKMLVEGSKSGALQPKDMLGMFSPFVLEMSKASSESNKIVMASMAEMDQSFRERMLDLIMSDPNKSSDEIERWQKWLSFGESALRKGAGVVRDALKGSPAAKDPKRIEQKKVPGIGGPATKKPEEKPAPVEGAAPAEATETAEAETQAELSPREAAEQLKRRRVEDFLLSMEEEMLADSDPDLMAEQCEEKYLTLPRVLRMKIEDTMGDDPVSEEKIVGLFITLKEIAPDVTERLAKLVMEDQDKQAWMKLFLAACAFPDEDAAEPEEDDPEAATKDEIEEPAAEEQD